VIYDNDDLKKSFRLVGVFEQGRLQTLKEPVPTWLELALEAPNE
jgi:hypothetical protein